MLRIYSILVFFLYIPFGVAKAATITEEIPLDFGVIAIVDNNAVYTLRVSQTGAITHDPEIVIISPGVRARYFLSSFPANTTINISITTPDPDGWTELVGFPNPSSSQFQVKNFDTIPILNTDSNGEKTIYIGATLYTSGTGNYIDAQFFTFMDVIVNY